MFPIWSWDHFRNSVEHILRIMTPNRKYYCKFIMSQAVFRLCYIHSHLIFLMALGDSSQSSELHRRQLRLRQLQPLTQLSPHSAFEQNAPWRSRRPRVRGAHKEPGGESSMGCRRHYDEEGKSSQPSRGAELFPL